MSEDCLRRKMGPPHSWRPRTGGSDSVMNTIAYIACIHTSIEGELDSAVATELYSWKLKLPVGFKFWPTIKALQQLCYRVLPG